MFKKHLKKYYAPKRWTLSSVFSKINGIKQKLFSKHNNLSAKDRRIFGMKREIEQMKKHIIFMEELINNLEK